jgi:hypothetical protein
VLTATWAPSQHVAPRSPFGRRHATMLVAVRSTKPENVSDHDTNPVGSALLTSTGGQINTKAAKRASGNRRVLIRKQLIPDVARRGCKSNAAGLAPYCFVDFFLVANCQGSGRFSGDKNCIAHFSARTMVLGLYFFPEPDTPKPDLGQLLFDLPAEAIFLALAGTFPAARAS